MLEDARVTTLAHAPRLIGIVEQAPDRRRKCVEIGRILEQQPLHAILDLILDAADRAGDHRPRLPHRFGHGEAEAFVQALLHDHRGVALQRIDDRRILVDVDGRQRCEMDPPPHGCREAGAIPR